MSVEAYSQKAPGSTSSGGASCDEPIKAVTKLATVIKLEEQAVETWLFKVGCTDTEMRQSYLQHTQSHDQAPEQRHKKP